MQGSEARQFQVTIGASGTWCARRVLVSGSPADMSAHADLLGRLARGIRAAGTLAVAPVAPTPAAVPTSKPGSPAGTPPGRVVPGPCAQTEVVGAGAPSLAVEWTYDGEREVRRREWVVGRLEQVDTTYDEQGRKVLERFSSSGSEGHERRYVYGADGRLAETRVGDDVTAMVYDASGRKIREVLTFSDGLKSVTTFEYDAAGRLSAKQTGSERWVFTYDEQGRPLQAGDELYAYSPDGRTRTLTGSSHTEVQSLDEHGNVLTATADTDIGSVSMTYDYGCWAR